MATENEKKRSKTEWISKILCKKSSSVKKRQKRLVSKHGQFYVNLDKISFLEKLRKYISDGFTTFLDIKWRWTLFTFCMGYLITWLGFACYYFAFGHVHGDIHAGRHPNNVTPCVTHVDSFTTALLFSVESQHTIGYGYRVVTDQCPHVITAVFFQFIIGCGVQCLIAGLVFAKLQRAKKRSETVLFSSLACVCYFNGKLRLSIRVGNIRPSHLLEVTAMGMLVKKKTTEEGDEVPFHQQFLEFRSESDSENLNLLWPAVVYHTIDDNSPLKNANSKEVLARYSELVVVLEGVVDSTSRTFQARTSYLPEEILYGCRFKPIAPVARHDGLFQISYFDFNVAIQPAVCCDAEDMVNFIPVCSAMTESRGSQTRALLTVTLSQFRTGNDDSCNAVSDADEDNEASPVYENDKHNKLYINDKHHIYLGKNNDHYNSESVTDEHSRGQSAEDEHCNDHFEKDEHFHDHVENDEHCNDYNDKDEHCNDHSEKDERCSDHSDKDDHCNDHSEKDEHCNDHSEKDEHCNDHIEKVEHCNEHSENKEYCNDHSESDI